MDWPNTRVPRCPHGAFQSAYSARSVSIGVMRTAEKERWSVRCFVLRHLLGPAVSAAVGLLCCLPPAEATPTEFVRRAGTRFILDENSFHFVGSNTYYLMVYSVARDNLRPKVDEVLQEVSARGVKVVRTWAFNDGQGWNALQTSPGVYDEAVFQGLDYLLYKAQQLGLKLVLVLVNNWSEYGGMDQYVRWCNLQYHDQFYTEPCPRTYYRNHIAAVIGRVNTFNGRLYRDDPTIFAWELANESRCPSDTSGDTLRNWLIEMSTYVRSLDANHLVTTGIEGFYDEDFGPWYMNGSEGVDFIRDHDFATVDYATAHSLPDDWGFDFATTMALVERQMGDAAHILGKPFVLEEFAKHRDGARPRARNHYDPRTYFSPGVAPRPVPGADPADVDPVGGAPSRGEAVVSATTANPTSSVRDTYFAAWLDLVARNCGTFGNSMVWMACHDTYGDYDGYCVYDPADQSTWQILSGAADLANGRWDHVFCDDLESWP